MPTSPPTPAWAISLRPPNDPSPPPPQIACPAILCVALRTRGTLRGTCCVAGNGPSVPRHHPQVAQHADGAVDHLLQVSLRSPTQGVKAHGTEMHESRVCVGGGEGYMGPAARPLLSVVSSPRSLLPHGDKGPGGGGHRPLYGLLCGLAV